MLESFTNFFIGIDVEKTFEKANNFEKEKRDLKNNGEL